MATFGSGVYSAGRYQPSIADQLMTAGASSLSGGRALFSRVFFIRKTRAAAVSEGFAGVEVDRRVGGLSASMSSGEARARRILFRAAVLDALSGGDAPWWVSVNREAFADATSTASTTVEVDRDWPGRASSVSGGRGRARRLIFRRARAAPSVSTGRAPLWRDVGTEALAAALSDGAAGAMITYFRVAVAEPGVSGGEALFRVDRRLLANIDALSNGEARAFFAYFRGARAVTESTGQAAGWRNQRREAASEVLSEGLALPEVLRVPGARSDSLSEGLAAMNRTLFPGVVADPTISLGRVVPWVVTEGKAIAGPTVSGGMGIAWMILGWAAKSATESAGEAWVGYILYPAATADSDTVARTQGRVLRDVQAHEAATSNGRAILRATWDVVESGSGVWERQSIPTGPQME